MLEWLAMEFLGSHILSIDQFERTDIEKIFTTSDALVPYAKRESITRVLQGAILSNMFFEPSTRTISFFLHTHSSKSQTSYSINVFFYIDRIKTRSFINMFLEHIDERSCFCLLYTSPSPRD